MGTAMAEGGDPRHHGVMENAGAIRVPYAGLQRWLRDMPRDPRSQKQVEAEAPFRRIGSTLTVQGEGGDPDRLIPFDTFPRVFAVGE